MEFLLKSKKYCLKFYISCLWKWTILFAHIKELKCNIPSFCITFYCAPQLFFILPRYNMSFLSHMQTTVRAPEVTKLQLQLNKATNIQRLLNTAFAPIQTRAVWGHAERALAASHFRTLLLFCTASSLATVKSTYQKLFNREPAIV